MQRRKFLKQAAVAASIGLTGGLGITACMPNEQPQETKVSQNAQPQPLPLVIATWDVFAASQKAYQVLSSGGTPLDAIEQGCMIEEADPNDQTVGLGGFPDRDGRVTLDACIMNHQGDYGAVVCLENILHPISVARRVMEKTPHVLLAGKGAEQFAIEQGFETINLLTEKSRKAWDEWKLKSEYKPIINIENHDTIGMLALDANGVMAGGCTTSGMAFKMAGRVGDSPIIGAGLFVDNAVGAATGSGLGEEVLKTVGSFLIVELMRQGKSPQEACHEAIMRIVNKDKNRIKDFQVGYIAVNKFGETGAFSIHPGFVYTTIREGVHQKHDAESYLTKSV